MTTAILWQRELATARRRSPDWDERSRKLDGFGKLKDDWDGDGATAPTNDVIETARRVLTFAFDNGLACPTGANARPPRGRAGQPLPAR